MLILFAGNPGRLLTKQELMEAVWPDVHVGEDSLFQCIREIRTALGDEPRELIRLVSGRGYIFATDVTDDPSGDKLEEIAPDGKLAETSASVEPARLWRSFAWPPRAAYMIAGLGVILVLAGIIAMVRPGAIIPARPHLIAMTPIVADGNAGLTEMAATVTSGLVDGLAKIQNIRVEAPKSAPAQPPDFLVTGTLKKTDKSWEAQARMTRASTGEIIWTSAISIATDGIDLSLQQSRLVAGLGYPLALRINELRNSDARPQAANGLANAAIEQAAAMIKQTSRERFATAETILKTALSGDGDNVDLVVALAALQLRGMQMSWYQASDSASAEANIKSILKHALRLKPDSIQVLETYCRFLNATNEFAESLVACSRALDFEPWNGSALFNLGLSQLQLGRFEDALATFKRAYSFDTPEVSRWTWRLGMGWANALMEQNSEALHWVQSAIAITPASGRSLIFLAGLYESLGQHAEAAEAIKAGLALRPGSNITNIDNPTKNASPIFLQATARLHQAIIAAGLPER